MVRKRRSLRILLSTLGVAAVASLAVGAIGVASASATTQHWYAGNKLAEGAPTGFKVNSAALVILQWKVTGSEMSIRCTSQTGEGTLENPVGGGAGTYEFTKALLTLSGCKFWTPSACWLPGESMSFSVTKGATTEFEGKPAVKFSGTGLKETLLSFTPQGCALGTQYFSGNFTGISNEKTQTFEFPETNWSITNKNSGGKAILAGSTHLETTSGQAITVAP